MRSIWPPAIAPIWSPPQPDQERVAELEGGGVERLAVGVVARPEDLAGRHQAEEGDEVGRVPPGGVDEEVRVLGHQPPEPGEVGDRGVGEDEAGARIALRQLQRVAAERRDAAPGVDQDRHAALLGEPGQVLDRGLRHRELLGPRVELDPVGAEVEAALRLGQRAVVRVDPAEVDDPPVGARLDRPRLVVGGRVAVRLVHREGDRPRARVLHRRDQLLGLLAEFVRVVAAEVGVGVEERQRSRLRFQRVQPAPRLLLDRFDLELLHLLAPPSVLSSRPAAFPIRFTASSTSAGEVPMLSRTKPAPCGPKVGPG